jgi:hypothetical protein
MNQKLAACELRNKLVAATELEGKQDETGLTREHVIWMLEQIITQNMSPAKEGRWLGWAQALICLWSFASLEEMKSLNKACSCDDEGCPHYGTLHIHIEYNPTPEEMAKIERSSLGEFSIGYNQEKDE